MHFTTPINTNEQSIDRVLAIGLPVVLFFWRKDCPPCQQLEPLLNTLAHSYAGKLLIARIDVRDNPALIRRYNITHVPGLVFVKAGQPLGQGHGAVPMDSLRAWGEYLLKGGSRPPIPNGPSVALEQPPPPPPMPRSAPATGGAPRPGTSGPIILNDTTFAQLISTSEQPVLVDFWAPWCGPCRAIAPAIERLAAEFAGRAIVAKMNVDENPRTAQRFGISSIPALYIFRRGQVVERLIGVQPESVLRQALARHSAG